MGAKLVDLVIDIVLIYLVRNFFSVFGFKVEYEYLELLDSVNKCFYF